VIVGLAARRLRLQVEVSLRAHLQRAWHLLRRARDGLWRQREE
jgi:hypothetical protein